VSPLTNTLPAPTPVVPDLHLTPAGHIKLPTAALAIASHTQDGVLFAACFDGGVYRIETSSGSYAQLGKHTSYASGVQFMPGTGHVVSAGYDGVLRWFPERRGAAGQTVAAHSFWSWKMRVSPNQKLIGSVTGQYAAGSYKYEPAPEREPSVKVFDATTGNLLHALTHTPPVLSVAFSPDSRYIAAGNMMGDVHVWDLTTGKVAASWNTPDFTCWGIIKSHHYIGGIFDLCFSPDGNSLLACGMGPMVDPMAGNGKEVWQQFAWRENPVRKVSEIAEGEAGHGLMEVVKYHPTKPIFVMSGRLAQGKWNTGLFDAASGKLVGSIDCGMRVTDAAWIQDKGETVLALCGATSQERKVNGKCPDFGHIKLFQLK